MFLRSYEFLDDFLNFLWCQIAPTYVESEVGRTLQPILTCLIFEFDGETYLIDVNSIEEWLTKQIEEWLTILKNLWMISIDDHKYWETWQP